jgi:DNA-binding XRE family transcriptional regulator
LAKIIKASTSSFERRVLKAFGKRVREIREKKHLSVYDLTGEDMPIRSRQHWQVIENGQKNVNLTTVFKVAHTLNITVEDLFRGIE